MKTQNAIHIYCTEKTRAKLEILAASSFRSMSAEVQALIERAFKQHIEDQTRKVSENAER
jgi:plasmid stability protein